MEESVYVVCDIKRLKSTFECYGFFLFLSLHGCLFHQLYSKVTWLYSYIVVISHAHILKQVTLQMTMVEQHVLIIA